MRLAPTLEKAFVMEMSEFTAAAGTVPAAPARGRRFGLRDQPAAQAGGHRSGRAHQSDEGLRTQSAAAPSA